MDPQYQTNVNDRSKNKLPMHFLSGQCMISPIYECGKVLLLTLADMYQLYRTKMDICSVRQIDELYNPICYGNNKYSQEERNFLYSLPPARAPGIITYSYADNLLPCDIYFNEYCVDGRYRTHILHLTTMVRNEILDFNEITELYNHLLYIPYNSITCEKSSNGNLRIEIIKGKPVVTQPIKSESGWHGVCLKTGLPCNDGKPHNGHDGKDRYLWCMNSYQIKKSGGNGFIGSPVHIYYSPRFYGQNVICAFGPSVLCCVWGKCLRPDVTNLQFFKHTNDNTKT